VYRFTIQSLVALSAAASLTLLTAAAPPVGVATANGSFQVDQARVGGNATVFEGNIIETGRTSSQLRLDSGKRTRLAPESRGVVYRDRLVLERGADQGNFPVEALSLRIQPVDSNSAARVSFDGANQLRVAALSGPVQVAKADGIVLARLMPGTTLMFTPQAAGAAAPSKLTGCLVSDAGKFYLTDVVSQVRFQVLGDEVSSNAEKEVEVTGTVNPATPEVNIVRVSGIRRLANSCSSKAAKAAAAGGAAAAGTEAATAGGGGAAAGGVAAGAGIGVATKAIIAGVIVAGVATGTAVAVVANSDEPTPISPSVR
jgi:hypothetical protein